MKYLVLQLHDSKSLKNHLRVVTHTLEEIGASFTYCADIISGTNHNHCLTKALATVVQDDVHLRSYYSSSGERRDNASRCWFVNSKSNLIVASNLLRSCQHLGKPSLIYIFLDHRTPTPEKELKSFTRSLENYRGQVRMTLRHSFFTYHPVDDIILNLCSTP